MKKRCYIYARVSTRTQAEEGYSIPEQLDRLFEQFYRLSSSRDSATGGSGLGLAISRGLVQAHGGTICAQSAHSYTQIR